ncbi:MAG: SDR family oxidoreductase [Anaerolineales bacterium]|nr:SDR family oxidoreductase [Anaerolineales bacterium]
MALVLVTGGAGFIGSHIVAALLERGDRVRVLDDFSSGRRAYLSGFEDRIEILEGDLRDGDLVRAAVREAELAFHLAAFVSVPASMTDPQTCFDVNVAGTVGLFEAARAAGVRKVVVSSSTAVYGDCSNLPIGEDQPLQPLSPYALSKVVGESYARFYTRTFGLPVVSLRYFNVYGPRQAPDSPYAAAIPIFVEHLVKGEPITLYGDGHQTRDFIFVGDVVRANLLAAGSATADGEAFNICTGQETSILDLLEELSGVTGRNPQVRFAPARSGDIYRSVGDPAKAADQLGFRAEVSLAKGLKETSTWMLG